MSARRLADCLRPLLATRYGAAAVRTAAAGGFGRMVALRDAKVIDIPLSEALALPNVST